MAKLGKFQFTKIELADNMYFFQIKKIKAKVWDEENTSFNWSFEVCQPPYIGKRAWCWGSTSNIPTPKNRLVQFGSALGYTYEQMRDPSFDTDPLEGEYVKGLLETTIKEDGTPKQHVTRLFALSESESQQLQLWLQQANVTGPAKVAVQASVPVVYMAPAAIVAPVAQQPVAPVQPVVTQTVVAPVTPVVATPAPIAPKRTSSFPF